MKQDGASAILRNLEAVVLVMVLNGEKQNSRGVR